LNVTYLTAKVWTYTYTPSYIRARLD